MAPSYRRAPRRAVERLGEDETFGATRGAAETNHRFRARLRRPVDTRTASVVLRRLHAAGPQLRS